MNKNGKPTLRVLLIEDNQDDVFLITKALRGEWHVVWKVVENEPALLLALDEHWDTILCDFSLPKFNAERALAVTIEYYILKNATMPPFIVISGTVDEEEGIKLLKSGARDFINKDFDAKRKNSGMKRLILAIKREIRQSGERLADRIRIDENNDAVIEAWGIAMEKRDHYTQGHTIRVTTLALRLAIALGVSHEEFININRGAALHDIGKIGIPDMVLLKQDPLTPEEMNIIKLHPVLAHDMLKKIQFLAPAIDIPYCHHEKWNGLGYPRGLLGEEIPFSARLFSVVDVYDALTTDRPYRKSWEEERALAYIWEERGKSFDPEIVDIFLTMMRRG